MCVESNIHVDLSLWQQEEETFRFRLDDAWFSSLADSSIASGRVDVEALLRRAGSRFLLSMHVCGHVVVSCDRCLQPLTLAVDDDHDMEVRLADNAEEDDHLLIVDAQQPVVDLRWLAYEQVALSLPLRHVHDEGQCTGDVAERLQQYADDARAQTDPRWEKLRNLAKGTIPDEA